MNLKLTIPTYFEALIIEYDSENTRKFDFQGENSEKLCFKTFCHLISINIGPREKCFIRKL